jgi:hypothetical protein
VREAMERNARLMLGVGAKGVNNDQALSSVF